MQNIAAIMEVRVLRTSARIWLYITHYYTFPSCLQPRPSDWAPGRCKTSHWPAQPCRTSGAGSRFQTSVRVKFLGLGGRREREILGESDVESWAEDAMLGPRTRRYHPHCPVSQGPACLPSDIISQ